MPFVPVSEGEEPRRGFRPLTEFEAPKRGFTPVQAAPAQPTPAPPGTPKNLAESAMPGVERPDIVPQPRIMVAPGTRLTPPESALPENQPSLLPSWAPEVTPSNPALAEALSPRTPQRLPGKLLEDMRAGRRDMSDEEYGGLLRQVEKGTMSLSPEDRALLQLHLPEASAAIEQAARVSAIRGTEAMQILPEGALRTGIEGLVRGMTLNNADASFPVTSGDAQADQLFSAANRAANLDEQARLAEHPIAGYGGEMAGSLLPFVKGVQLLRGVRAARGLAPVVETPGGFVAEGATVGTPLEFLRKPEGAEQMTRAEEAEARLLQAGVGLTVGALADFTTASAAQYFGRYMARLRDERAGALLEEEALSKGFASTDEYAASLVDIVETQDGLMVRPRIEPASALPTIEPKRGFTPIDEAPPAVAQATPIGESVGVIPPFRREHDLRLDAYESKAREHGLTPEQTEAFRPEETSDHLTGLQSRADRESTLNRALDYVNEHPDVDGHYVALDLVNLGGLNAHLGEPGADKVFRAFADIIREEMEPLPGHVNLFRHGGDEMSAVALGVDRGALAQALERINTRAAEYARAQGLDTLPHTKAGKEAGTGINFGVSRIRSGETISQALERAHVNLELMKKGARDVDLHLPEGARPAGSTGPAGGVREIPAGTTGRGEAPAGRGPREGESGASGETLGAGFEIRSPDRGSAYRPGEPAADLFLPRNAADADHGAALRTLGRTVKHVQTGTFPSGLSRVSSAADVAHVVAPIRRDAQESFLAVVTNDAGDVLRIARLHRGAQGAAAVDPALVAGAITNTPGGARAWIAHNHPSGAVAQSDADRALTLQLAGLLDGTGTRLEGGVVIGPGGRVHSAFAPDGREMTGPTRAAPRKEALPVTERRLTGGEPTSKPLESPEAAHAALKQHGKDKEGALLLDDDNRPVGFVELSAAEMRELRSGKGGGSDRLLSALDQTNASGFIVRANSPAAAGNMHAFAEATGRTLVDVIDSAGNSLRTKGDLPTQSTFYANPFWVAGREFAKDIGAHPGRAAAEAFSGAVAGATLSDEEPGSARWWLDVAAGAAGSAILFNAARGTRLLGPGSIADNARLRLGQWVEGLPLIGRGPAELRELKTKQRLMRQIIDRQTEQVGKHLAEKFTPAERAMMADLIERRGIVKDLNIIHRQAQALDDYLTQITRRMKELKMLPAEMEEGGYLHRYYAKHLGLDKAFMKAKGQSLAGSYTIARGTDDVFQREFLSPGAARLVDEFDRLKAEVDKIERKAADKLDATGLEGLVGMKARLRQIGKVELHEYVGEQNGQVRSFIFAGDEVPRSPVEIPGTRLAKPDGVPRAGERPSHLDNNTGLSIPGTQHLSPTARRWGVRGSNKDGVLLHRDWTKAERQSWGEIDDAGYRYVRGMAEASHDMSLATLFDTVARHGEWVSDAPRSSKGKDWVEVPKSRVNKNSPLQKYGALAGKYVRPDVWNGISNYGRAPFASGPIGNVYRDLLARWKLYKTVYNPVTHFNNTWSNVEMLHMAGYSARDLGDGIRHLIQGEKSAVWREARDSGLFGTDWGSSLLKSSEGGHNRALEELAEQLRTQPDIPDAAVSASAVMRLKEWWINSRNAVAGAPTRMGSGAELAKAMGRPAIAGLRFLKKPVDVAAHSAQKLYRMEDEVFKLSVFSAQRRRGAAPDVAAREAQAFFFDYNDLPEGVKIIRDFPVGVPFISYTYFAIPAIARNAVQHPERMLAIAAAYEAMNYAALVHDGMGPGEYWATAEAEDTVSPPWERGRALWGARNTIHLPSPEGYRLSLGRAHALGNPFMDEAGGREKLPTVPYVANFWGSSVFGGNPLHSILDVMANEDWKGKEIYAPGAPQEEKIRAAAAYLYQAWTPSNPAVPGSYHQQRVVEGLANDKRQAEAAGEKPGLAGAVVDAANDTAALLGLQGFTGLDRMGNEVLTRDALAASFGVKLRPIRWAMGQEFESARMDREIQDKERFLDAEARKKSEQRITPERFEEMRQATLEGINEALAEQRKRDQAKTKLEQQGRWR
ncbi:MAG: hypothetical protein CVV05_15550 [Gammaproteobacteria bacterium HGW-Gammaproteobacteria-1]|jgi:GGDEF domain-containing protein|nr:MAG: hypothetical protein CVV05_15550 [Gammaproteobacteria bacterium HGW-Gammaproteobacteria-1]